jgi:tRNA(Ile)-lysidine synthase
LLEAFKKYVTSKKWFNKNEPILVALSGGIDSVVLVDLLNSLNYNISLAHCNFKLRGKESDKDEEFCKLLAEKHKVKIHLNHFETTSYAKTNKQSVQEAARELRYNWFEELVNNHHYKYVLTAHHLNDQIETFFINMLRGTGLKGLIGIPEKNKKVLRPLLSFPRSDIENYAKQCKLKFRVDASNDDIHYQRNFIRLNIVPGLKSHFPGFETRFYENLNNLKEDLAIIEDYVDEKRKIYRLNPNQPCSIQINELLNENHVRYICYQLLKPFNFNSSQVTGILKCIGKEIKTGKYFNSKSHTLLINRTEILIEPLITEIKPIIINSFNDLKKTPFLRVESCKKINKTAPNELMIHKSSFQFPLTIRSYKTGDKFKPFGMKGFKLVSDFYRDSKLSMFDKKSTLLLINGNNEIVWVIGQRSDERYRVMNKSHEELIKLTYLP